MDYHEFGAVFEEEGGKVPQFSEEGAALDTAMIRDDSVFYGIWLCLVVFP